jgi:hypothetical protein
VRLWGYLADDDSPTAITLYDVANANWSESTLTFDNAPAVGGAVATQTISGYGSQNGAYYDFDVTAYLQAAVAAGKTKVSFALKAEAGSNVRVSFATSEAPANTPALVITT